MSFSSGLDASEFAPKGRKKKDKQKERERKKETEMEMKTFREMKISWILTKFNEFHIFKQLTNPII